MDRSPKGREIEHVEGSPGEIISRGEAIYDLGTTMLDCATQLETIKNAALDDGTQKGRAIESLKDSVGDSYEVLREAGDLYQPVGPVIKAYGEALDVAQPIINNSTDDCVEKWAFYQSLPGDRDGSTTPEAGGGFLGIGDHDADSDKAKEEAANNQAKKAAYDDWHASAEVFDGGYDTWEDAFDTAVNGVEDQMAGSIKDSFWSSLTDFLEIAALIVGVAALIIGGPILAALALAVAAALLITTVMSYANGERSLTDIAFATIGVIPFGKLTKISGMSKAFQVFRGGNTGRIASSLSGLKGMKGITAYSSKLATRGEFLKTLRSGDGLLGVYSRHGGPRALTKLLTGSERGFTNTYRTHKTFFEGAGPRLAALRDSNATRVLAGIDFSSTALSTTLRNIKYINLGTGNDFQLPIPSYVKPLVG